MPVALHLDHCPDRDVITDCLEAGWNSVLFDASRLPVEENQRQTVEVVAEAAPVRRAGRGRDRVDHRGRGRHRLRRRRPPGSTLDVVVGFIEATGVDVFAPAIGNAHGVYSPTPDAGRPAGHRHRRADRIPMALHGGTGLTDDQFTDLIARGCAKVNISTALKVAYMKSNLAFLRDAEQQDKWDPPSLFTAVQADGRWR